MHTELSLTERREQAHLLLDALPEEKLLAIRGLLEVMVDPFSRSLALAPLDDEELLTEMAAAIERSCKSLARGEGASHEDILRELGL